MNSLEEQLYCREAIRASCRLDGRKNAQSQAIRINTNSHPHLLGSTTGQYAGGSIHCAVKYQVLECSHNTEAGLELCIESVKPGYQDELNRLRAILNTQFLNLISKDSDYFKIQNSKKHRLQIAIGVVISDQPHVSQLQMCFKCIKNTLESARLPKIVALTNEVTQVESLEITEQYLQFKESPIDMLMIVGYLDSQILADVNKLEYESVDSCFLLSGSNGKLQTVKGMKGKFSLESIKKVSAWCLKQQFK